MIRRTLHVLVIACAFAPVGMGAQTARTTPDVPAEYRPPPGMCRIWVENVPPDKQPAPTDCTKALRNKPANAQVIFGDEKDPPRKSTPATSATPTRSNLTTPVTGGRGNTRPRTDSTKAKSDSAKAKRDSVPPKRDTVPPSNRGH
ncbi:MAG TPA: hypothetical protein VJR92_06245 [Gemmatimonadaceae bacterium]|nr:hypothetical protein [Gemmatimonadaceae bacterium]